MDEVIEKTIQFVREQLKDAEAGHDYWHAYRVWRLSRHIAEDEGAKDEKADMLIVELGALLHDLSESKLHDEEDGIKKVRQFLEGMELDEGKIDHIENIIRNISFKNENQDFRSKELDIIQDADRLDALGAIGIARTFNFGGYIGRPIHDPGIPPNPGMSKEEYKKRLTPSLNHFHEKLLNLKDLMNTDAGKSIAEHRHQFLLQYLDEFHKEWEI